MISLQKFECPLCDWVEIVPDQPLPSEALASVFGPGVMSAIARNEQMERNEKLLRDHFETHKLELWVSAAQRAKRLDGLVNTPEIDSFVRGVMYESAHQRERWGPAHDREKSAEHWYWLVGYLGGKALRAHIAGDREKALHHTISSAAALFHWHDAILRDTSGSGIGRDADLQAHDDGRQAHETAPVRP